MVRAKKALPTVSKEAASRRMLLAGIPCASPAVRLDNRDAARHVLQWGSMPQRACVAACLGTVTPMYKQSSARMLGGLLCLSSCRASAHAADARPIYQISRSC